MAASLPPLCCMSKQYLWLCSQGTIQPKSSCRMSYTQPAPPPLSFPCVDWSYYLVLVQFIHLCFYSPSWIVCTQFIFAVSSGFECDLNYRRLKRLQRNFDTFSMTHRCQNVITHTGRAGFCTVKAPEAISFQLITECHTVMSFIKENHLFNSNSSSFVCLTFVNGVY